MTIIAFLLGLLFGVLAGAFIVATLSSKYTYRLFRLADRIRAWLNYGPK